MTAPLSLRAAFLLTVAAACLAFTPGPSSLARAAEKPAADIVDLDAPQSAPKPTPTWVKIIDQGDLDPRLKGYKTPEGVKVEIVAENPVVVNPVGMTFGDDGTPYVLEWRPSPGDEGKEKTETIAFKDGSKFALAVPTKRTRDAVKVLTDSKGKGTYDAAKVVLEEDLPSSAMLHDGWLYVSGRGSVRRYKQSKSDGPYDVKEIVAQGFGGFFHHQVSGMGIGPDGWLYITAGDGDNIVEGSDGSRATVLRTGAVFRCRPDGSKLHAYSLGFVNPYRELAFDALGNAFQVDNDGDGGGKYTGCRLMHVVEGADFGWRVKTGARCCTPDPLRTAVFGELPGKTAPMLKTGHGGPAGLLIYNDTRFPENYRGLIFYPDVVRQSVRAYKVERRGATFEVVQEFEFLRSADPLFRPCQMLLGPDGAMYLVDWRSELAGGKPWGDGEHGRILRISWAGAKEQPALPPRSMDSWAKIAKLEDDDLLKTLLSEDGGDRDHARQELARRGEKERPALSKLFKDAEQPDAARAASLGALAEMWNADVQAGVQFVLLKDSSADLRRLAADALGLNAPKGDEDVHSALLRALNDVTPEVRRAAALAMSRIAADGAPDILVNTWSFDDGRDPYLRDGLVRAIENLGAPAIDRLIALGESGVQKETDKVVEAFTMMRTRAAAEAIPRALENPHLSDAQRAALIRSYENYLLDPPVSLNPAMEYLKTHQSAPATVKQAGIEVLTAFGAPRGDKPVAWLLDLMLEKDTKLSAAALTLLAASDVGEEGARLVGQAFVDMKLPAETQPQVVQILRRHSDKDAACAKLLTAVMKSGKR